MIPINGLDFMLPIQEYLTSAIVLAISVVVVRVVRVLLNRKMKKNSEENEPKPIDLILENFTKSLIPLLYLGGLYLALSFLKLPDLASRILDKSYVILTTFFIVIFISRLAKSLLSLYWNRRESRMKGVNTGGITLIIEVLIWTIGAIFLLDNLGLKISAVVAGLGIGGVAVALASQAILGDLFSYFVILFDKPFDIGDFVIFDSSMGTIEKIGIKATRIRSLGGEELIVSNADLTKARISNFKRMQKRRITFTLGVAYDTPLNLLREIPSIVKKIIENIEETSFDRAYFKSYGDFSLIFEIVYYINSSDYMSYVRAQEEINLKIFEEFSQHGISFAYPTQTLFLRNETTGHS